MSHHLSFSSQKLWKREARMSFWNPYWAEVLTEMSYVQGFSTDHWTWSLDNDCAACACAISQGASGVTIMFSSPIFPRFLFVRLLACWQQMELLFTFCAYDPTEIRQEMIVESVLSVVRLRRLGSCHSFAEAYEMVGKQIVWHATKLEPLPGSW